MKVVEVKKGERRRILRVFSSSIAKTYRFRAEPSDGHSDVSGIVEVKGSNWVLPKAPVTQPLGTDNVVEKGAWDTFFGVIVIPDSDVRIVMEDRAMKSAGMLAAVIGAIVVLAGIAIVWSAL